MAIVIENPTVFAKADQRHINNIEFPPSPIQADNDSANQYCTENGYSLDTYTYDESRTSNDGARLFNYYDKTRGEWLNSFGFAPVIITLTTK